MANKAADTIAAGAGGVEAVGVIPVAGAEAGLAVVAADGRAVEDAEVADGRAAVVADDAEAAVSLRRILRTSWTCKKWRMHQAGECST